jgi:hypothetical protein
MSQDRTMIDLTNVDWKLLCKQKETLAKLVCMGAGVNEEEREDLDGILALIDNIQDQAEDFLGSELVFNDID